MWTKLKALLAVLVVLAAVCVWTQSLRRSGTPDLQALRDIGGVTNTVVGVQRVAHGYQVQCRLINARKQPAQQVVMRASLVGVDGQTLAANPLAGAANVAPGESREFSIFIPLEASLTNLRAQTAISLVRWQH